MIASSCLAGDRSSNPFGRHFRNQTGHSTRTAGRSGAGGSPRAMRRCLSKRGHQFFRTRSRIGGGSIQERHRARSGLCRPMLPRQPQWRSGGAARHRDNGSIGSCSRSRGSARAGRNQRRSRGFEPSPSALRMPREVVSLRSRMPVIVEPRTMRLGSPRARSRTTAEAYPTDEIGTCS
jgi:hypothetical protein